MLFYFLRSRRRRHSIITCQTQSLQFAWPFSAFHIFSFCGVSSPQSTLFLYFDWSCASCGNSHAYLPTCRLSFSIPAGVICLAKWGLNISRRPDTISPAYHHFVVSKLGRDDKECLWWQCILFMELSVVGSFIKGRCSGRIIRLMCGCWYQSGRLSTSKGMREPAGKLKLHGYRAFTETVQVIKFNLFIDVPFLINCPARIHISLNRNC